MHVLNTILEHQLIFLIFRVYENTYYFTETSDFRKNTQIDYYYHNLDVKIR